MNIKQLSKPWNNMRITFVKTITELARKNSKIILLTGDLGFSVFEEFIRVCPKQFINAGIAEQNMTGMAAGLASEGKIPIIYSIIPFVTMRNFEQIRNDVCYQNLNVKIVGIGAGFSYGPYGHTHHALEDIGILRTLANITILCPGDPMEAGLATKAMMNQTGPVYLRLGKAGEPVIHKSIPDFIIGKAIILNDGKDLTLVATSTMLERGKEITDALKQKGISVRFISMPTIKPFDEEVILKAAKETKAIFSLEEHSIIGGLGSAIAEVLAEHNTNILFRRFGVPDRFTKCIGKQEYMREVNDLGLDQILKGILSIWYEK